MKIITDLAADLTPDDVSEYDIAVVPLTIVFPDEGEVNAATLTPDQFYARLASIAPKIPTTAMPSPGELADAYRVAVEKGTAVLSLHISSGLSGTLESARIAAEQVGNQMIDVWDTMTLSGGQRFQVLAAARAAAKGWSLPDIRQRLEEIRANTEVVYTLDTLDYLAHGGRIGRVQALASSLLNIKPLIFVDKEDGKYSTAGRVRTMKRALAALVDYLGDKFDADEPLWVSVVHGQFLDQAEKLAALLNDKLNVSHIEILRISPVLGVHTGPGIVGVTVLPMRFFAGLET